MERDSENKHYFDHARTYDFNIGRFLSADRVFGFQANPQSLNRYAYVMNQPTKLTDPWGFATFVCWMDEHEVNHCTFIDDPGGGGSSGEGPGGSGHKGKPPTTPATPCASVGSLNWLQRAELAAAQYYANLTGGTVGFGAGADAGAGIGSTGSKWNFGVGGSASTLIVADASGNSGFLNSISGGFSAVKMKSPGSWWGAGAAAGPSLLVSPFPISQIAGPSGSISAGGGTGVLGGGLTVTTSGAATLTVGWGAGAEAGISPQGGTSEFTPFCHE
jgi:RHS repeat-associated protein